MGGELFGGNLALMLLSVLAEGPSYGYAITKALRDRSSGAIPQSSGTLYSTLRRLESEGLIRSTWEGAPSARQRRCYELLSSGRIHLQERSSKLIEQARQYQVSLGR